MKTEEAKKNIQETLSKLESFNRDSDPVFSSQVPKHTATVKTKETLQIKTEKKIAQKKKRTRKHEGRQKVEKAMLQLESSRFTLTITATN